PDGPRPRRGARPLGQRGRRDGARMGRAEARAAADAANTRRDRESGARRLLPRLRRGRRTARRVDAPVLTAAATSRVRARACPDKPCPGTVPGHVPPGRLARKTAATRRTVAETDMPGDCPRACLI